MAIINYTDQIKYTGRGYLDAKIMPVKSFEDLKKIPLTQRFEGLTITVLNENDPQDYWLIGGITNQYWIQKNTSGYNNELRLVLEEGFLKLMDGNQQMGENVDLNSFWEDKDIYITSVDYVDSDDSGNSGVFLCFTYSDSNRKYLDMSQFLSDRYESGSGIVIEDNVISLDSAIVGRIEYLEFAIENEISTREALINDVKSRLEVLSDSVSKNAQDIVSNKNEINALKERVDALSSVPDGETIGITDDENKALYVKVLEKEGNILGVSTNEGESGLYAFIPVFYEDNEL